MAFTGIGSFFGGAVGGADIAMLVKLHGLEKVNKDIDRLNAKVTGAEKTLNRTLNAAMIAGAAAMIAGATAAAKFESSFTGVTKTVNGLRDPMGKLNADGLALAQKFRNLSLEIPTTVHELNRIGELGGQLGIAKGDLESFSKTIAELGVTTDLSYADAATSTARFINVTKQVAPVGLSTSQQIERIGSTIVELGNNLEVTESEILAMSMRLAGAGNQIGLTQSQILSFSAALTSLGLRAEMGGTAISTMFIEIATAVGTGNDKLEMFAEIAGTTTEKFAKQFETDAAGALQKFITGLGDVATHGGNTFVVLEELGLSEKRLRDALSRASSASGKFTEAMKMGTKAYQENNALAKEAAQRFATVESQSKILKNVINDTFITIGNNFLPALSSTLKTLNQHPETIQSVIKVVATLAISLGTLATAIKGIQLAKKGWAKAASLLTTDIGKLGLGVTAIIATLTIYNEISEAMRKKELEKINAVSEEITEMQKLISRYEELTAKEFLWSQEGEENARIAVQLKNAFSEYGLRVDDTTESMKKNLIEMIKLKNVELDIELKMTSTRMGELNALIKRSSEHEMPAFIKTVFALTEKITDSTGLTKSWGKELGELTQTEAQLKKEIDEITAILESMNLKIDESGKITEIAEKQTKAYADIQKELADAGIKTTDSIQAEIASLEKLIPIALKDTIATKNLSDKLGELYEASGKNVTSYTDWFNVQGGLITQNDSIRISAEKLTPKLNDFTTGVGSLKMQAENTIIPLNKLGKETEKLTDETKKSTEKWGKNALILTTIFGKLGGVGAKINETAQFIATLSTSGLGPLGAALSAISFAIDLFGESNERVSMTIEDVLNGMGELGIQIIATTELVEEMNDKFESQILKDYTNSLNYLLEKFAQWGISVEDVANETEILNAMALRPDVIKEYTTEIENLESAMAGLMASFEKEIEFTSQIDQLQFLADKALYMKDTFGAMKWPGLEKLLKETIADSYELLSTLDPTSKGYADLSQELLDAEIAFRVLNGTIDIANVNLYKNAGELFKTEKAFNSVGVEMNPVLAAFWLLAKQQAETNSTMEETTKTIEKQAEAVETLEEKMSKLYDQTFKEASLREQYNNEIANTESQIASLNSTIADLEQKKVQIDIKLLEDLEPIINEINKLANETIPALKEKKIQIDIELAADIAEINTQINKIRTETIPALEAEKIQIDIELAADIAEINTQINKIRTETIPALEAEKLQIDIELEADTAEINAQIDKIRTETIAPLEAEKLQIQTQLTLDVTEQNQKIIDLNAIITTLNQNLKKTNKINFYDLGLEFERITGNVQALVLEWGEMLDVMFRDYSQFEKDIETATNALEKATYFKLDFDITDADEQINAAIFRMKDFLKTLDPKSKAFKDAKKNLDDLIKKFRKAGGELDYEAAIKINTEQAGKETQTIEGIIEDLYLTASENTLAIDADIAEAESKIISLGIQIVDLQEKAAADKLAIDANILEAESKIINLGDDIIKLQETAVADKLIIDADITAAENKILELFGNYAELVKIAEKEKAAIDVDISNAESQIGILKEQLRGLRSEFAFVLTVEKDPNLNKALALYNKSTYEQRGLPFAVFYSNYKGKLFHEGGIVKGSSGGQVDAILKSRETVLPESFANKYGDANVERFIKTLNPNDLETRKKEEHVNFTVNVNNATPETYVEILKDNLTDEIYRTNIDPQRQKVIRKHETAESPI